MKPEKAMMNRYIPTLPFLLAFSLSVTANAAGEQKDESNPVPAISSVSPLKVFAGDTLTVIGENLDGRGMKFKLGKTALKVVETTPKKVVVKLPKSARTGQFVASLKRETFKYEPLVEVLKTPKINVVPRRAAVGSIILVKGKNLDVISSWRLGDVPLIVDENYKKNSKNKVQLIIPKDVLSDKPVVGVAEGREFFSKKTIETGVAPTISLVMYIKHPDRDKTKGHLGAVFGEGFAENCTLKVNGKRADVKPGKSTELPFELKNNLPKKPFKVVASNGKFKSETYLQDGRTEGYAFSAKQLEEYLFQDPIQMPVARVAIEMQVIEAGADGPYQRSLAAGDLKVSKRSALNGEASSELLQAMKRLRVMQGILCKGMVDGKAGAKGNSEAGLLLERATQGLVGTATDSLIKIWRHVSADMLGKKQVKKLKLKEAADAINSIVEARDLPWISCREKYYGDKSKSAYDLVKVDMEELFRKAIPVIFEDFAQDKTDDDKFRKDVSAIFKSLHSDHRDFWIGIVTRHYRNLEK